MSTSPVRWQQPARKASTPFFPGAWPSSSSQLDISRHTSSEMFRLVDIEAQSESSHGAVKNEDHDTLGYPSVDLPHLDHVMDFHRRISQSVVLSSHSHPSNDSLVLGSPSSTSVPQLAVTDTSVHFDRSQLVSSQSHSTSKQRQMSTQVYSGTHIASNLDIRSPDARRLSSVKLDGPLLNYVTGIPSLSLPSQDFSPGSMTSYFSNEPTSSNDPDSPAAQSPLSSAYSPLSTSNINTRPLLRTHSSMASSFPIPDEIDESRRHGIFTPSAATRYSRHFAADSPILPADDGRSPHLSPSSNAGRRTSSQMYSPSSVEMDQFGYAASYVLEDTRSALSIPTSFQSASGLGSMSQSSLASPNDTARGLARRQSSASLSLSLSLASAMDTQLATSGHDTIGVYSVNDIRSGVDLLYPSRGLDSPKETPSFQQVASATQGESLSKGSRFMSMKKVKKFGDRIKKLFKGKPSTPMSASEATIRPSKTIANNVMEYTSVHPIKRDEVENNIPTALRPRPAQKRISPSKRRSMPSSIGSVRKVSNPRPLRPTSFLSMDGASGNTGQRLLSMPNIVGLSHSTYTEHNEKAKRNTNAESVDGPISTSVEKVHEPSRSRTQTNKSSATCSETQSENRKSRRFSISKANMEALRSTVVPHPPLPAHAIAKPATSTGFGSRQRSASASASASAGDRWYGWSQGDKESGRSTKPRPYSTFVSRERGSSGSLNRDVVLHIKDSKTSLSNPKSRRRSQTQTSTQSRIQPTTPKQPSKSVDTSDEPTPTKRRSRGFSLSSAISKRALRARSIISGRQADTPALPIANPETEKGGMITSVSGVSFNMITASNSRHHEGRRFLREQDEQTRSGCADYEPDIVIDKMSFAEKPEVPSTIGSSTDLSLSIESGSYGARSVTLSKEVIVTSSTVGNVVQLETDDEQDVSGAEMNAEEREEEKEFMRALGLEFDEIVRRARDE
ncbi:hypothetical protein ABKN59_001175 [Abortiporus biennis]